MRCFSDRPEEAPNPGVEDLVPRSPGERPLQALAAYDREERHRVPSFLEVQPEARESPLPELTLSDVLSVLPEEEEDAFCLLNPLDAIPVPPMHPRAASLSTFCAESHHGSDGGPTLHYTSASASNAAFLGHQSGQVLPSAQHVASNEQVWEHNICIAIRLDQEKSLCPVVHFTIAAWPTGQTTGYMFIITHWVADHNFLLCKCQAVMAMKKVQLGSMTEKTLRRLKTLRDNWLHPQQLEVGYVVTPAKAVARAVAGSCLGCILSLVHSLNLLIKEVTEKVKNKCFLIVRLWQTLHKIIIHFAQSQAARDRLEALQVQCGLPPEIWKEKMPSDLSLGIRFLFARWKVFHAYQNENPDLNLTHQEWRLLHYLACLLKPFEDSITRLRKGNATLGQILHELHLLESNVKGYLQLLQQEPEVAVADAAIHIVSELLQSLESSQDLGEVRKNMLYQAAAFLHPYFRDHMCKYLKEDAHGGRWQVKDWVIWQTAKEYLRKFSHNDATEVACYELEYYLQDSIDVTHLDPLMYWHSKRHTWPSLSAVALQYFSCPPSPGFLENADSVEVMIRSRSFKERLALILLKRDWEAPELRVPNTITDTGSLSMV
ncbi:zinc finger BED domain-containing protein 4-like [Hemicordylus capensis]|uniref:zinc finger BED domain-containing protein 4-like n=1 Tax=Hemicordylus capensis TaxID=884348 RepID=UPI00230459A0|nr:zinc finger BED domain-containing protein 4-like [Hemicordylus capensis]